MNSIRLGGPAHGIVTKTIHKTMSGGGWGQGIGVVEVKGVGGGGGQGIGVVEVKGVGGGGGQGIGVVGSRWYGW